MRKSREYSLFKPPQIPKLYTKAERYLLPSLGISLNNLKDGLEKRNYNSQELLDSLGYLNTYLYWSEYEEKQDNCCFLLFQPTSYNLSKYFPPFYNYISAIPTFLDIKVVDIQTIVLSLSVEDRFNVQPKKCVELGKYSRLGDKFAKFYFSDKEDAYKVIMKTEEKRLQIENLVGMKLKDWVELDSIPDIKNKETLKYEFSSKVKW